MKGARSKDAAVLTASVGVDAVRETDVGAVVFGENGKRAVDIEARGDFLPGLGQLKVLRQIRRRRFHFE